MNRVVVDPVTLAKLRDAWETLDLCDTDGQIVGRFIPIVDRSHGADLEPQISEEELDRRQREGGGRPLADILKDLEKRS
jgi:hypothetical protein